MENSFRFMMYILLSSAASRLCLDPDYFLYIQYIHSLSKLLLPWIATYSICCRVLIGSRPLKTTRAVIQYAAK